MFCVKIWENVGFDHRNEVEWKWRGVRPQIHGGDHHRHIMVMYDPGRTSTYPSHPPERGFRFHCLGGGDEVGNVGIMMEDQQEPNFCLTTDLHRPIHHVTQTKHLALRMPSVPFTHRSPWHGAWLAAQHGTRLHGSSLTAAISEPMWYDCHKVSSIEGYPLAWDKRDIDIAVASWTTMVGQNTCGTASMDVHFSFGRPYSRRRHASRRYRGIPRDVHG